MSHLLFANNTIIFCGTEEDQVNSAQHVLHTYEVASTQAINFNKTNVLFSKGVKDDRRARIVHLLDIQEVLSYDKYLGLPIFVGW